MSVLLEELKNILEETDDDKEEEIKGDVIIDEEEVEKKIKKRKKRKKNNKNKKKFEKIIIKPLYNDDKDYLDPPHPDLYRIPFSICAIAEKGGGKTVATQNFIKQYLDAGMFDKIYYFSPTIALDVKQKLFLKDHLKIDFETDQEKSLNERQVFTSYNEKVVSRIIKRIGEINKNRIKENKPKMTTLMIFDDIVEDLPKNKKKCAINKLAFNMRHYFISFIMISQYWRCLDVKLRTNFTGYWLFESSSCKEKQKFIEELGGRIGCDTFEAFYDYSTEEKFGFLNFNKDDRKLMCKFDDTIHEY